MLNAAEMHDRVPAVWRLAQLAGGQRAHVEKFTPANRSVQRCGAQRNYRRQNFWRPEYRLFEEGFVGISCENTGPIVGGRRSLEPRPASAGFLDVRACSQACGAGTPR